MKCPKCNSENSNDSKFCKKCGAPLNRKTGSNRNIIIIGLIIAILLLAIGVLYGTGVLKGEVPLETKDFGAFKIDVPVGSKYVLSDSSTQDGSRISVGYMNKGEYQFEAFGFFVGNNLSKNGASSMGEFYEKDGNMEIYKNESSTEDMYFLFKDNGDHQVMILGNDVDTIKRMANSLKDVDISKLKSNYNSPTTASSTTGAYSSPSSISILGGSFSTGSGEQDKTYASINVGTAHAGENLIVQILYSRGGNALNNGNMVPATVHSNGYLEIASADAYHYYPDYATINIYDTNNNLLTTTSVSLSPEAGTQTF